MSYPGTVKRPNGRSYSYFNLVRGSMGGYGLPENDPHHQYEVTEHRGNGVAQGWMSLRAALDDDDVPDALKDRIRALYRERGLDAPA